MASLIATDTGSRARPRGCEALLSGHGRRLVFVLCIAISFLFSSLVSAVSAPQWWSDYDVLDPQAAADDYAAANQGQLKHTAVQARNYLDQVLAPIGGAFPAGSPQAGAGDMLDGWLVNPASANNFLAINLGQLKAVAAPYYQRLAAIGMPIAPPWGIAYGTADDFAMANLGQLKNVFSFELDAAIDLYAVDSTGSGVYDWWKLEHFGSLTVDLQADPDGDGLSHYQEFLLGTDPYQATVVAMSMVSGNDQLALRNQFAALPLVVSTYANGQPLADARIRHTNTNDPAASLAMIKTQEALAVGAIESITDMGGGSAVYVKMPDSFGEVQVEASVGGEAYPAPLLFTLRAPVYVLFDGEEEDTYGELSHVTEITEDGNTFYQRAGHTTITSSRLIPVDTSRNYRISGRFRSAGMSESRIYYGLIPYDENENRIYNWQVLRSGNDGVVTDFDSTTITTADNLEGWHDGGGHGYQRHLAFYFDGDTDRLPDMVVRNDNDGAYTSVAGNVITLTDPLPSEVTSQIIPNTTVVKNTSNGLTYIFAGGSGYVPDEWTTYSFDALTGEGFAGQTNFWKETHSVRLVIIANYKQTGDHILQMDDLLFEETTDSDEDGLPDVWELRHLGTLEYGADTDTDGDGFTLLEEYLAGTDPMDPGSLPYGPPEVYAGPFQAIDASQTSSFFLEGTASSPDPEVTSLDSSWTLIEGDAEDVTIISPETLLTEVLIDPAARGVYTFRLSVSDGTREAADIVVVAAGIDDVSNSVYFVDPLENAWRFRGVPYDIEIETEISGVIDEITYYRNGVRMRDAEDELISELAFEWTETLRGEVTYTVVVEGQDGGVEFVATDSVTINIAANPAELPEYGGPSHPVIKGKIRNSSLGGGPSGVEIATTTTHSSAVSGRLPGNPGDTILVEFVLDSEPMPDCHDISEMSDEITWTLSAVGPGWGNGLVYNGTRVVESTHGEEVIARFLITLPTGFETDLILDAGLFYSISVTANSWISGGTVLSVRTKLIKKGKPFPPGFSVNVSPPQELIGPKYRRLSLSGLPLTEDKPQAEPETDYDPTETYIDALTLNLVHAQNDLLVSLPGSDLSLSVRRNYVSEVWRPERSLYAPYSAPDKPFGPNWTSGMTPNIQIELSMSISDSSYGFRRFVHVTDENGTTHRFLMIAPSDALFDPHSTYGLSPRAWQSATLALHPAEAYFVALPNGAHDTDNMLASLKFEAGEFIFKKRYGTEIRFEDAGIYKENLYHSYQSTGLIGTTSRNHSVYYRATRIEDRFGTALLFQYSGAETLIPSEIAVEGRPAQKLTVIRNNGRITSVTDPLGNKVKYVYANHVGRADQYLQKVIHTSPDDAELSKVVYTYEVTEEPDDVPAELLGFDRFGVRERIAYEHYNLTTIHQMLVETGNSSTAEEYIIEFDFVTNNTMRAFATVVSYGEYFEGYYPVHGLPRMVHQVTLPDSIGSALFATESDFRFFLDSYAEINKSEVLQGYGSRVTTVVDAGGNTRIYRFEEPSVVPLYDFDLRVDPPNSLQYPPFYFSYGYMEVMHPGSEGISEFVYYDPENPMLPSSIVDYSGNTTTFEYGDALDVSVPLLYAGMWGAVRSTYPEVTRQIDALNNVQQFSYSPYHRIMDTFVDGLGRSVHTVVDTLGRRENVRHYDAQQQLLSQTSFQYHPVFKNIVSLETQQRIAGDPGWAGDRAVAYTVHTGLEGSPAGNIYQQTIDPGGLNLTTTFAYDLNNRKTSVTDARGFTTDYFHDPLGRIVQVRHPAVYDPVTQQPLGHSSRFNVFDSLGRRVGIIDENGNATVQKFDGLRRLVASIRIMDPLDVPDFSDPASYIDYQPGPEDLVTSHQYNALGARTLTIDPEGVTSRYGYDALLRLRFEKMLAADNLALGLAADIVTEYQYDPALNTGASVFVHDAFKPTSIIDARGYRTDFEYDALYRLIRQQTIAYDGSNDALTEFTYDAVGNKIEETVHPGSSLSPRTTSFTYNGLDQLVEVVHADASSEEFAHLSFGGQWRHEDALGRVTTTEFDALGREIKITAPLVDDGSGTPAAPVTQMAYDGNGNLVQMITPLAEVWDYEYDERNRQVAEIAPAVSYVDEQDTLQSTPERPETLSRYDAVGNVIETVDPRGFSTWQRYDAANRQVLTVHSSIDVTSYGEVYPAAGTLYDRRGLVLAQFSGYIDGLLGDPATDLATIERIDIENEWDAAGRLIATEDAAGIIVSYEYDPAGNEIAVIDGNEQRTEFGYDGLGRNTLTRHADNSTRQLFYNAVEMTRRLDELSRETLYTHDSRGRLTSVSYDHTSGLDREYTYDAAGNLLEVEESGSPQTSVAYSYDSLNRVITETSAGITHSYGYDLGGNRTYIGYGDAANNLSRILRTEYDALGRATLVYEDNNDNGSFDSGERGSSFHYDLSGNLREHIQPNGDRIVTRYDALGRRSTIRGPDGSDNHPLYQYEQNFDLFGNLAELTETYPSADSPLIARTILNSYDAANRLSTETISSGSDTVVTSYSYDDAHNRLSKEVTLNSTPQESLSYHYPNDLNQLASFTDAVTLRTVTFSYDLAGNRITRSEGSSTSYYAYDPENRLTELEQTTSTVTDALYRYGYDYRTRRVLRDESEAGGEKTQISFSGGVSVQEWTETTPLSGNFDQLEVEYIRGSDWGGGVGGLLYSLRSGGPSYNHYNSRGDVTGQTDASGSLTYQAAYEAFGRHGDTASSQEWGSSADRQRANTKDEDPTGLLNEGFRYRDLDVGAFITRDPLGFVDGPNLYTYVVQNPWTYYDPLGLYSFQDYKRDFSRGLDFINDNILANPRVQGGLQALGGAAEMGVAAYGTAQTAGLGSIPLAGLAVHGFDNFQTGVRQAWTGEQTNSLLQTAVLDFGGSQELADKVQMGSDVLAMGAELKLLANVISVNRAVRMGEAGSEVVGDAARNTQYTFRGDSRSHTQIFNDGFHARGSSMDLFRHAADNTSPPSTFIPTSRSPSVASNFGDNIYVIRPRNGIDVNQALGPRSPFPGELEIAIPFRIHPSDIRGVTLPNQGISILNSNWVP